MVFVQAEYQNTFVMFFASLAFNAGKDAFEINKNVF